MEYGYEVFHPHVATVADFYIDILGFALEDGAGEDGAGEDGAGEDGAEGYVVVTRGDLRVGCSQHPDASLIPRKPPNGSEVVLRVEDVQAELQRVQAAGWPIEDPLQRRPWGLIDFRVFDPTGQYIRISSAAPRD